ncbi:hypothetical protein B0H17DRAFT_1140874 [Mycena rosella]|uniref:Uncharacterized protein n=1 Tax=Mycena rosella TaxID=1033263 RepID=A0AAD7G9N9_MYCRO|nr:hypothetical protein B0H17DRAFT_1140874 [Mycena rosella]
MGKQVQTNRGNIGSDQVEQTIIEIRPRYLRIQENNSDGGQFGRLDHRTQFGSIFDRARSSLLTHPLQQCFKPVVHAKLVKNAPAAYWFYFDNPKPVPASKTMSVTSAPAKKGTAPVPAKKPMSMKCKEDTYRSSKMCLPPPLCHPHLHVDPPPPSYSFLPGLESICQDVLAPFHALDRYRENRSSLKHYLDSLYGVGGATTTTKRDVLE